MVCFIELYTKGFGKTPRPVGVAARAIFDYKNMQNIIIVARIGNDGILIT